jgi:protein-disulfide isomerase
MKYLILLLAPLLLVNCTTRENPGPERHTLTPKAAVNVKIDDSRVVFGPTNAPVTIVKYADFQCPACGMDVGYLEQIKQKYGDQVRIIHKNVPLEFHLQAKIAAQIYESLLITNKDKARKFYELAYQGQRGWSSDKDIWAIAKKVGATEKEINAELKKGVVDARIREDIKEHTDLGFQGTPAYMINGLSLYGAQSFENLSQAVELSLKK